VFLLHARLVTFRESVLAKLRRLVKADRGSTVAEYALVLVLVSLAVIGVLSTLGATLQGKIEGIIQKLTQTQTP